MVSIFGRLPVLGYGVALSTEPVMILPLYGSSRSPAMQATCAQGTALMRMPRLSALSDDVDVVGRELEAGSRGVLPDRAAVELLPRCLVLRDREVTVHAPALIKLFIRDQDISCPVVEVDADAIACPKQCEASARSGFGRRIEDRGRTRSPGLPSVPDAGERSDTALNQRVRRLHVDHLGSTRVGNWTSASDEQEAVLIDFERWIVDAAVVVLRPVKDDRPAFEGIRIAGVRE